VETNGDDPTPYRWRLTVSWSPTMPGVEGLHDVMGPIVRFLASLDSEHHVSIYIGTIEAPSDP
jgi:hypothetical protein